MPEAEVPLQRDMFTGELVDNRSRYHKRRDKARSQPTQPLLFSLQETLQIGVSVRPWLKDAPKPKLELVSEDPRTEEEKERDLRREAEALTGNLFANLPNPNGDKEAGEELEADAEDEQLTVAPEDPETSQWTVYLELVRLLEEQTTTLWIDEAYRQSFYSQLPLAILSAMSAGLTGAEITAAIQIGIFRGNQKRAEASNRAFSVPRQAGADRRLPNTQIVGYRVKARRKSIRVRSRRYIEQP